MDNLNKKNNENDFSLKKAELENELTREIKDEIRNNDFLAFEELEEELRAEVDNQLSELEILKKNKKKIGNPESLGKNYQRCRLGTVYQSNWGCSGRRFYQT